MAGYRNEYKYVLDACDLAVLMTRVRSLLPVDSHAGQDGTYTIRSLYFDDMYNRCYYENEDGVDARNKYRIRYYNDDTSYIVLERKSKLRGMTKKTSTRIGTNLCETLIRRQTPVIDNQTDATLSALLSEIRLQELIPKVIVTYDRAAFTYPAGNVRITFDTNLTSSDDIAGYLDPKGTKRPVYRAGQSVLEVKWDSVMPTFISDMLDLDSLRWSAFSKFYHSRRINSYGGIKT